MEENVSNLSLIRQACRIKPFGRQQNFRTVQIQSTCRRQTKEGPNNKLFLDIVENIVGKGENAGNQHFLLFPQCFPELSFRSCRKTRHCVVQD